MTMVMAVVLSRHRRLAPARFFRWGRCLDEVVVGHPAKFGALAESASLTRDISLNILLEEGGLFLSENLRIPLEGTAA